MNESLYQQAQDFQAIRGIFSFVPARHKMRRMGDYSHDAGQRRLGVFAKGNAADRGIVFGRTVAFIRARLDACTFRCRIERNWSVAGLLGSGCSRRAQTPRCRCIPTLSTLRKYGHAITGISPVEEESLDVSSRFGARTNAVIVQRLSNMKKWRMPAGNRRSVCRPTRPWSCLE